MHSLLRVVFITETIVTADRPHVYHANVHSLLDVPHIKPSDPSNGEKAASKLIQNDTKKDYDLYIFSQSWQPEFCAGFQNVYPGCHDPQPYWKTHMTLHGLWPEYQNGGYPQFCTSEPLDADLIEKAIGFQKLVRYWPDVKIAEKARSYPEFWQHEWSKHGTCSNLDQIAYFQGSIDLLKQNVSMTPEIIQQHVGKHVNTAIARAAYSQTGAMDDVVLQCRGQALAEIHMCWSRDEQYRPKARIVCPPHVLKGDTCRSEFIFIRAFG
uniref:Uncharacterized protein AlNc14C110G6363 n=1 Tax=Albugo laibachii Nc14 TaxID=890382 RepID=F0WIG3_9STRA|nr:conserved hypothetical protein [Albugo laibachii Nc14]|eukprot:CCA21045.1 conserved hypothetical protein [Albugo laibachii Nc14]